MPRIADKDLTSKVFRTRLSEADDYAAKKGLDVWATRVVWIGLLFNALGAKRFAERRSNYRESKAWACYSRLVEVGVFVENEPQEGISWTSGTEPWESDSLRWFDDLVRIAAGGLVPKGFPVNKGRPVVRQTQTGGLRVVNG